MVTDDSAPPSEGPKPKSAVKDLFRIVTLLAFFALVGWVLSLPSVRAEYLDAAKLRGTLQNTGLRGILVFVSLGGLLTGIGMPRIWISLLAGWLYGAMHGTAIALAASLVGATVAFFLARWILRGPIKRRMPRRLVPWYEKFNSHGFRYMLIIRLFPFSMAIFTNLLGGVSRMSYGSFLAATVIGYLPLTLVFALFGKGATGQGYVQLGVGAIIMLLVILAERRLRHSLASELPPSETEDGSAEEGTVDMEAQESNSGELNYGTSDQPGHGPVDKSDPLDPNDSIDRV